ncbi:MAG: exonuclease subunit SbcD [Treponema sp.]|jgi:exonuclease SbcD|nr:exonuclease subunit SbcD [Treponema sp.]
MIKILHTADLHLGKSLHDQSLAEDQAHVLKQLAEILKAEEFHALIIAGDVYDRSIPSPEAVGLFSAFLADIKKLKHAPELLVIPGNHDSAVRLGYGKELFRSLGVHFVCDTEEAFRPAVTLRGSEGDSCACFLLPFLGAGSLKNDEGEVLRSQAELAAEAAKRLDAAQKECRAQGASYAILAAHLFAGGGRESDSERIFLGGAEQVDMGMFSGFDYAALGHLHRFQKAGAKDGKAFAWYSGSPLAYSFDEAGGEKCFISLTLEGGEARADSIPVQPLRNMRRLAGNFRRFMTEPVQDEELKTAKNDYLEITLTGNELTENALSILKMRFPYLLSVHQGAALSSLQSGKDRTLNEDRTGRRDITEDFKDFLAELYGEAEEDKVKLFNETYAEAAGPEEAQHEAC